MRGLLCWLFGHAPAWQQVTYRDCDQNLLFRRERRCKRCDRRVLA